jgi:DNA polymerase-3 subunit beta
MLASTHYAASSDESRFILNGVLLSFREASSAWSPRMGGAWRMWEQELELEKDAEGECVIPRRPWQRTAALAGRGGRGDQDSGVGEPGGVEFGQMLVMSKLIDATYPNFRQVIPVDTGSHCGGARAC